MNYKKSRLYKYIRDTEEKMEVGPRGGHYAVYETDTHVTLISYSSRCMPEWLVRKYVMSADGTILKIVDSGGTTYEWYGLTYEKNKS